ncbi:DUF2975 domain-containing protein [Loigolactobacillus binensis]|uniref:DUF2975 domain-containing protein n=1 Tax=Loigolactobacillus binensis TaxID=2559922 RepID=A0ABW3EEU3_9LACO|nr:DUF2975 domain-containing protein [Loigolactobacillus binensis]
MRHETFYLKLMIYLLGLLILFLCVVPLPLIWPVLTTRYPTIIFLFIMIYAGLYVTALIFFFALFQGQRLLHYIDIGNAFSTISVTALRKIKLSATVISCLYVLGLPVAYLVAQKMDAPGVLIICTFFALAAGTVAVFGAVLQKLLQNAITLKAENDLTV